MKIRNAAVEGVQQSLSIIVRIIVIVRFYQRHTYKAEENKAETHKDVQKGWLVMVWELILASCFVRFLFSGPK